MNNNNKDSACKGTHRDDLEVLRKEGCPWDSDYDCMRNHLDVLKYLREEEEKKATNGDKCQEGGIGGNIRTMLYNWLFPK